MTTVNPTADAERLAREMEVARNIQRDFLPEALPMAMGVQLEAALQPAGDAGVGLHEAEQCGACGRGHASRVPEKLLLRTISEVSPSSVPAPMRRRGVSGGRLVPSPRAPGEPRASSP